MNTLAGIFGGADRKLGASEDDIRAAEQKLGCALPEDYKQFLRFTNGFEGFLNDAYLALWPTEELVDLNERYRMKEHFPGATLVGSDGSNTGYFFRGVGASVEYRAFDFIERDLGPTEHLGATIIEALAKLACRADTR